MEFFVKEKKAFSLLCYTKVFTQENLKEIPNLWGEFFTKELNKYCCGEYGICVKEKTEKGFQWKYSISCVYDPVKEIPENFNVQNIPELTWIVFPFKGSLSLTMKDNIKKVWEEWVPSNKNYEIDDTYMIEFYDNPTKYEKSVNDEKYYYEIWLSLKKQN